MLDMSHVYRVSHFLHTPLVKLEREIKTLQLNYDADFKTANGDKKKIELLKKKFNEKNVFLTNRKEAYQEELEDYVERKLIEENQKYPKQNEKSKIHLFMEILEHLEGQKKLPVKHQDLVRELADASGMYSREEANEYIRKMIRDASIYESKPGYYNRV